VQIDNAGIAELLAKEAEQASDTLKRALKRAARAALLWPEEASKIMQSGRSLTELRGIGPYLEKKLRRWIEKAPNLVEPPPIRRTFLTLSKARHVLAGHPHWAKQYRGDLQMHSNWSDGMGSIWEMTLQAYKRGYEYIGITDHSKGLKIAGGVTELELSEQGQEIRQLNEQLKAQNKSFRVLRSVELNLNPEGLGDMQETAFKELDLVVGSFHSKLRESEDETERYLAALRNPHVTILGHPVGRIYNHRIGLKANWRRVCACAAELDKAVEIDAYPDRQDLSLELLRIAKREGARIAIDSDAHAPDQLGFVELGLAAALLAGIPQERIVNFMSREKLLLWAQPGI
jgi:histidinol phosphatase-like PHP family hydrolase